MKWPVLHTTHRYWHTTKLEILKAEPYVGFYDFFFLIGPKIDAYERATDMPDCSIRDLPSCSERISDPPFRLFASTTENNLLLISVLCISALCK
jgi:hypothetical protein